jgi:DNA-binding NtrC family response regulator
MQNSAKKCRKKPVQSRVILVVDDDIELLLVYQGLLEANDYEACLARNGAQALGVIKKRKVDAILCDLCMPELSGDLLYGAVSRAEPRLRKRFIFITGNAESPTYEDFLKHTKASVLTKPLPINRLLKKLESVLGNQAQPSN